MPGETYHIFLNGEMPNPAVFRREYQAGDVIVAVDGGLSHLSNLQLVPNLLIGDMDSISDSALEQQQKLGVKTIRYPSEKDETDFELALRYVYQQSPRRVNVFAGLGGRLDHTLTNLSLASSPDYADPPLLFQDDGCELFFIHKAARICGKVGDLVSLIPWGGAVEGVTTTRMKYPLRSETLFPDRSRGISNVMLSDSAEIHILSGRLLCIHQES